MTETADYKHKVTRLSGRRNAKERVLYEGDDWMRAHAVYETEAIALRQGEVRKYVCGTLACSQRAIDFVYQPPPAEKHWRDDPKAINGQWNEGEGND